MTIKSVSKKNLISKYGVNTDWCFEEDENDNDSSLSEVSLKFLKQLNSTLTYHSRFQQIEFLKYVCMCTS